MEPTSRVSCIAGRVLTAEPLRKPNQCLRVFLTGSFPPSSHAIHTPMRVFLLQRMIAFIVHRCWGVCVCFWPPQGPEDDMLPFSSALGTAHSREVALLPETWSPPPPILKHQDPFLQLALESAWRWVNSDVTPGVAPSLQDGRLFAFTLCESSPTWNKAQSV